MWIEAAAGVVYTDNLEAVGNRASPAEITRNIQEIGLITTGILLAAAVSQCQVPGHAKAKRIYIALADPCLAGLSLRQIWLFKSPGHVDARHDHVRGQMPGKSRQGAWSESIVVVEEKQVVSPGRSHKGIADTIAEISPAGEFKDTQELRQFRNAGERGFFVATVQADEHLELHGQFGQGAGNAFNRTGQGSRTFARRGR